MILVELDILDRKLVAGAIERERALHGVRAMTEDEVERPLPQPLGRMRNLGARRRLTIDDREMRRATPFRAVYGVARVGPAGSSGDATRPDQIRRFGAGGTSSIIVEDRDSNAASPYFQFDNSVGVSDNGQWVAFVARTTTAGSSRSVFVTDGTTTRTIAVPGTGLTSIDNFAPAVNNDGLVAFRATDLSGRISVFDVAPRTRDVFRARLISIDGELPGPAGSRSFRLDAGPHELEVAELIDTSQFDDVQLRQRDQKSGAYKKLRLDVAADTTYLLGAHLIDAHRNEILSGAYWEPVIYSQNSEPCR